MECPRTEMFQLLFGGKLTPEQQGPLADHAATCPACHAVVETMLGGPQTQQGGPQTDSRPMTVGSIVGGRFRIERLLGAGGMGIVVAAIHLELGNRVAIKFMRDDKLEAVAVERFIREARAVVKLRTEHVCRVFDVARLDNGAPYIVMELLDGVDLGRTVAARPLPATIAVEYVMQAAVGLAEAHALGIVHRDLKPANLFVTRRHDGGPLVKVLDFGIAKALDESDSRLTRTRVLLGSPGYISPEQLDSPRDVDARTDIWALGVTLYQLLSGRLPFWGRNQTEIAVKIAAEPPPPLEGDPRLVAVVLRCLEKACSDRYPDVVALAADLVPFGGPRARRIAAAIARAAKSTTGSQPILPTPGALPAVSLQAPTAATGATSGTTATGGQPALVGIPPTPTPGRPMSAAMPGYVAGTPGSGTPAAGAVSTAGTGPVNAANSLAMTLAVSRPVDMSRYIAESALAAGSGAARAQRARRWQLAAVGVVGVIVAAAVALAVRSPSQPDAVASAPGGGAPAGSTAGGTGKPGSESAAPGAPSSAQSAVGSSPGAAHAADASASQSAVGSSSGAAHAADAPASRTSASSHPAGASASASHAGSPAAASPSGPRHAGAPSAHPGTSPASRHTGAATAHAGASPMLHPSPPAAAAAPAASGSAGSASSASSAPSVTAPASPAAGSAATDARPERPASAQRGSASPPPPLDPERKRACAAMLEPGGTVKASLIPACWCQSHDQLHAQAALSRLPKSGERDAAKRDCHKLGVELQ